MKVRTARRRFWARMMCPALACLVMLLLIGYKTAEAQEACRPSLEERQRYGFVALAPNWYEAFAVDTLNAGWYVNPAGPTPPHEGMDQTVVIRVRSGYSLDAARVGALVDANPGATWFIGNEPDCIWQDEVVPEEYARIYHDLYAFIKNQDQMSQVAAGGIVQPTPLRLEYLDRVLAAYQTWYGRPMPVDLWHIHNAILNEERGGWGAGIPPGFEGVDRGVSRSWADDNDNFEIFREQVLAFRQWMVDRGYGGYPLIISEYGVLMPEEYGYDVARVNQYMTDTFAYLAAATDPVLGAPWDGGRLVQRWAWFSLDEQPWNGFGGFNGNLFDPETTAITAYGENFAGLTADLEPRLQVDLGLGRWQVPALPEVVTPTQTVDQPVGVRLVNAGTAASGSFHVRLSYAGPVSGTVAQQVDGLEPHSAQWIAFTLPGLLAGRYDLSLEIDVDGQVDEAAECNNQANRELVVPSTRLYLPLILSGRVTGDLREEVSMDGAAAAAPRAASVAPEPAPPTVGDGTLPVWTEYPLPQPGSYPGQLALDEARRALWVTERDGDRVARFDLDTESWQEYDLDVGSRPWGLALDASGNVWFAESGTGRIGKLEAASGVILEYGAGLAPGCEPWGVALGDSGLVYFTERAAGRLGWLDPTTGGVTDRAPPWTGARPGGLAFSNSATYGTFVWFADTGASLLGRFRPSDQQIDEFHTTPPWEKPLISPEDVTMIDPGNPWLSNTGGNGISLFRFTTLQNFNTIDAPTPESEPYGIVAGGRNSIWFTERAGNKLARFGPQDYVIEYQLPTAGSQPTDIVVDGEGCAWYAAPGTNRIGRLCLREANRTLYLPLILRSDWREPSSPSSSFGTQLFWGDLTLQDEPAAVGADWARLPLFWKFIEPSNTTPANYSWPPGLEQELTRLRSQGVNVILTLTGNPEWAAEYEAGPVYPGKMGELVQFMQAVVGRYGALPYGVKHWEFYNEPDNGNTGFAEGGQVGYFGHQPAAYVQLLQAVYQPLKAVDPEAQIVFGGIAYDAFDVPNGGPFVRAFLDGVLQNGGGSYFDIMNFHYYPAFAADWEAYGIDILGKYNYLRDKLASYGVYKPFICTETSMWSDACNGGSDELQSRYVAQVFARSMSAGLQFAIWFRLVDDDEWCSHKWGLLDPDYQPKLAYWAYQTLAEQLGTATFVRTWTLAETGSSLVEAYEFGPVQGGTWPDGTARIVVVWHNGEEGQTHIMAVAATSLVHVGKYGGETPLYDGTDGRVDGIIPVTVGLSPAYLRLP